MPKLSVVSVCERDNEVVVVLAFRQWNREGGAEFNGVRCSRVRRRLWFLQRDLSGSPGPFIVVVDGGVVGGRNHFGDSVARCRSAKKAITSGPRLDGS